MQQKTVTTINDMLFHKLREILLDNTTTKAAVNNKKYALTATLRDENLRIHQK